MWVSSFIQFYVTGNTAEKEWYFDICESCRERRVVFCKFHKCERRRVKTLISCFSDISYKFVFYSKRCHSVIYSRGRHWHIWEAWCLRNRSHKPTFILSRAADTVITGLWKTIVSLAEFWFQDIWKLHDCPNEFQHNFWIDLDVTSLEYVSPHLCPQFCHHPSVLLERDCICLSFVETFEGNIQRC